MTHVLTVLALLLLAQSLDGGSRAVAPTSSAHVDRHIDAHVAPPQGTPAPPGQPGRDSRESPPEPAIGTGGPQSPAASPPAIQLYRDPLYRDRRY